MRIVELDRKTNKKRFEFTRAKAGKMNSSRTPVLKYIFNAFVFFSLVIAFIIGKTWNQIDYQSYLSDKLHNNSISKIDEFTYFSKSSDHKKNYLPVGIGNGYGGSFAISSNINTEGIIEEIIILKHNETVSFFNKIENRGFFKQFEGKKISDRLIEDQDIDIISGATISSVALQRLFARQLIISDKNIMV